VKWTGNVAIPESQLETWSHQGSVTQSRITYNTIKNVLEGAGTPYSGKTYSVFLQGSYGNDTNIYAESDVDIVVKLDDCWQRDLEALSQEEKDAYKNAYVDATYTHVDFKKDVLKVLTAAMSSCICSSVGMCSYFGRAGFISSHGWALEVQISAWGSSPLGSSKLPAKTARMSGTSSILPPTIELHAEQNPRYSVLPLSALTT